MTINEHDSEIDNSDELNNEDKESLIEEMRDWFYKNFEDPAERTPYESAEGGYIWIWGGPYDAEEVLDEEFGNRVPRELIEQLVTELNYNCDEWAPTPSLEDYDDFVVEDIALITEFHSNFTSAILDVESLLKTNVNNAVENCFYRLLFVNVITALETYLSDAFINTVVPNPELMRRFIESTPEFQSEKVALSDIFKAIEEIEQKAKSYLADVVWHNLQRVKPIYYDTLGITFPKDIGEIFRAIIKRHDIVHRNGKSKSGEEILIQKQDVEQLIAAVESFTQDIDGQLSNFKSNLARNSNPDNNEEL